MSACPVCNISCFDHGGGSIATLRAQLAEAKAARDDMRGINDVAAAEIARLGAQLAEAQAALAYEVDTTRARNAMAKIVDQSTYESLCECRAVVNLTRQYLDSRVRPLPEQREALARLQEALDAPDFTHLTTIEQIAQRLADTVRESFEYADGKRIASPADERRIGRAFADALAAFDAYQKPEP